MRNFIKILLGLLIIAPPLALGGVHPETIFVYSLIAPLALLILSIYYDVNKRDRKNSFVIDIWGIIFLSACAFTAFQLVPLPPNLLEFLSPKTAEIIKFSLGEAGIYGKVWMPLSLAPPQTAQKLIRDLSLIALYFAVFHWVSGRTKRLAKLAAFSLAAALVVVALIIVQNILNIPNPYFGLYSLPVSIERPLYGTTFINRNHLAGFLLFNLFLAGALYFYIQSSKIKQLLVLLAGIFVVFIFFSLSRGAVISLFLFSFMAIISIKKSTGGTKRKGYVRKYLTNDVVIFLFALVTLVVTVVFTVYFDKIFAEFSKSGSSWGENKLLPITIGTFTIAKNFPFFGVGRGATPMAVTPFFRGEFASQKTISHIESAPFQAVIDWGVIFGVAFIIAVLFAIWKLWKRTETLFEKFIILGIAALFLQNIADFNLEFLGVSAPFIALLAGISSRYRLYYKKLSWKISYMFVGAFLAISLPLGIKYTKQDYHYLFDRFQELSKDGLSEGELTSLLKNHPANYMLPLYLADYYSKLNPPDLEKSLRWLDVAEKLNPLASNVHFMKGAILAQLGLYEEATVALSRAVKLNFKLSVYAVKLVFKYKFPKIILRYSTSELLVYNVLSRLVRTRENIDREVELAVERFGKVKRDIYEKAIEYFFHRYFYTKDRALLNKAIYLSVEYEKLFKDARSSQFKEFMRARLLFSEGKELAALRLFLKLFKSSDRWKLQSFFYAYQIYLKRKEYSQALKLLSLTRVNLNLDKKGLANLDFLEGKLRYFQGNYQRALKLFENALLFMPSPHIKIWKAKTCVELAIYSCAIKIYRQLVKKPNFRYLKRELERIEKMKSRAQNIHLEK